jgi:hypothetical protein
MLVFEFLLGIADTSMSTIQVKIVLVLDVLQLLKLLVGSLQPNCFSYLYFISRGTEDGTDVVKRVAHLVENW